MRAIDADALIADRIENGLQWWRGDGDAFRQLIERQPTYNPWRKIDDVVGLEDKQRVVFRWAGGMDLGCFENGVPAVSLWVKERVTHYMVIPEVTA